MIFIPSLETFKFTLFAIFITLIFLFGAAFGLPWLNQESADDTVDIDATSDNEQYNADSGSGSGHTTPASGDDAPPINPEIPEEPETPSEPPVPPAPPQPPKPPEPAPPPEIKRLPEKKWTALFYVAYDNNIGASGMWEDELHFLELVGSDENLNLVALVDLHEVGDSSLFVIDEGSSREYPCSVISESWGDELDMDDHYTLREFLLWGIEYFPAEHYNFHFDDHGGGWQGGMVDDNSNSSFIFATDFADVLDDARDAIGKKIDVVSFEACHMASFEFAWQIADTAQFFTGQETIAAAEDKDGYTVGQWLIDECWGGLKSNPDWSAREFAEHQVTCFYEVGPFLFPQVGQTKPQCSDTMCTMDLGRIEGLKDSFDQLSQELYSSVTGAREVLAERQLIAQVIGSNSEPPEHNTESFTGQRDFLGGGYMHYYDLYDFVYRLSEHGDLLCNKTTATTFLELLDEMIVSSVHGENFLIGEHPDAHGVDIFLPYRNKQYNSNYDLILVSEETMWDDFLKEVCWNM